MTTIDSMFERLSEIPFLRGASKDLMERIVGMAKFHFLKYDAGQTIVTAGEPCSHARFVLDGSVRISIENADGRFRISQTLTAPDVISPDFLFGHTTLYPGTATAIGTVNTVQISKNDLIKILQSDSIFLYNVLNYLSMNSQKCIDGILSLSTGSIEERIATWVVAMTQPTSSDITLSCRQRDLYSVFGVQRSSFFTTLDRLRDRGIITYSTGEIRVPDRRAMLSVMRHGLE